MFLVLPSGCDLTEDAQFVIHGVFRFCLAVDVLDTAESLSITVFNMAV